ncbi:MFS transporter [Roseomonas sp. GCM10028921]
MIAAQFQSVGGIGPALLSDPAFGLDYLGLGTLLGAYLLPGVVVSFPGGSLAARVGERRMALTGLVLMGVGGLLVAFASGFPAALVGRLLAGIGAALLTVILSALLMERFIGYALAPVMGAFLATWPFGIALALLGLPPAVEMFGGSWRAALLLSIGPMLVILPMAGLLLTNMDAGRALISAPSDPAPGALGLAAAEVPPLAAIGCAWATLNAGLAVLLGFAPALLVQRGFSAPAAGALTSLVSWMLVLLLPLGGALLAALRRPMPTALAALVLTAASMGAFGAFPALPVIPLLLAAGLLLAGPATFISTLPAGVLAPQRRARGMGLYYTIFYAGMAVLPPLAGGLRDATGRPDAPILAAACFLVLAAACLALVPRLSAPRRP